MKMVRIIGIAGGTGSGKSTLAYGLQDMFPEFIQVVHFDDYQKKQELLPKLQGISNWDHPNSINMDQLLEDIQKLKNWEEVVVMTKSEKHNPEYNKKGRIPYTLKPRNFLIVEGYMALTDERLRNMYDMKFFLDLEFHEMLNRRTKFINPEYTEKILLPMHKEFVEPTKKYADIILDVKKLSKEETLRIVSKAIDVLLK